MVVNPSVAVNSAHLRMEVRKVVCRSGRPGRDPATCVKTEKVNSRFAALGHVSADIEFGKCRKPRQRRSPAWADSGHVKRCDCNPALPVESIQRESRRNERAHD